MKVIRVEKVDLERMEIQFTVRGTERERPARELELSFERTERWARENAEEKSRQRRGEYAMV